MDRMGRRDWNVDLGVVLTSPGKSMEQVDIGIGVEATNGGTTFLTTLLSVALVSNVFMFAFN